MLFLLQMKCLTKTRDKELKYVNIHRERHAVEKLSEQINGEKMVKMQHREISCQAFKGKTFIGGKHL